MEGTNRPILVTVVAILSFIQGIVFTIAGVFVLVNGNSTGIFLLAYGVMYTIIGYGLFMLKRWIIKWLTWLLSASVILCFISLTSSETTLIIANLNEWIIANIRALIGIGEGTFLLWYFNREDVKSCFGEGKKSIYEEFKTIFLGYMRVLKITKKPANPEYSAAIKITGLGILLIGAIGLIIYIIAKLTGYIPSSI